MTTNATSTPAIAQAANASGNPEELQELLLMLGDAAKIACGQNPIHALDLLNQIKRHVNAELLSSFFSIRHAISLAAFHTHTSMNSPVESKRDKAQVYFLQNQSGKIKIGYSKDVSKRIKQLSIGSHGNLVLLALMEGGSKAEAMLHTRFKKHKISSEWFNNSEEIMSFISNLKPAS